MKNLVKRTLLVTYFVFSGWLSIAQPADPQTDPDNPIPITGLEYLLIGGGVLGGYKLLRKGRKSKDIVSETDK